MSKVDPILKSVIPIGLVTASLYFGLSHLSGSYIAPMGLTYGLGTHFLIVGICALGGALLLRRYVAHAVIMSLFSCIEGSLLFSLAEQFTLGPFADSLIGLALFAMTFPVAHRLFNAWQVRMVYKNIMAIGLIGLTYLVVLGVLYAQFLLVRSIVLS